MRRENFKLFFQFFFFLFLHALFQNFEIVIWLKGILIYFNLHILFLSHMAITKLRRFRRFYLFDLRFRVFPAHGFRRVGELIAGQGI